MLGRPGLCLGCLKGRKLVSGQVAEAYEETEVTVRVIFDGLNGPGSQEKAVRFLSFMVLGKESIAFHRILIF